ncbi:MAG: DUF1016 N-terminal domain-containing protein [Campylobacterota bacterium]
MAKTNIQNRLSEDKLYQNAIAIIDSGRDKIAQALYNETTKSYYLLGKLIVEDEQQGNKKAQYGKKVIETLSKKLTIRYGRGFSLSTLKDCRQFYQKRQSLTGELDLKLLFTHYTYLIRLDEKEMKPKDIIKDPYILDFLGLDKVNLAISTV